MVHGADATFGTVGVQAGPTRRLAECDLRGNATRAGHVEGLDRIRWIAGNVPLVERVLHGLAVHGGDVGVQAACAVQLAQNAHDAASAVHVFNMVFVGVGRHLAKLGHDFGHAVNVGHGEVDFGLLRNRQNMQDGVGGAAHGDVQRNRVLKCLEAHGARQHGFVVLLVVALAQLYGQVSGALEQLFPVCVRGHHGAVAGQRQAQRFGQAVHGVGREHARAATAGGASRALHFGHIGVTHLVVGGHHHGVDQVELLELHLLRGGVEQLDLAGLHGATGHKHHGDVQAHGGHQHAGGDLVAVGDADHGVGAVRVDHVLDRIGNDVAAGQRIQHTVVAHGDAVVHCDGVELLRHTAGSLDFTRHQLPQVLQVHMSRHKLGERIDDRDDGLAEVIVLHAGGAPEGACPRHVAAGGGSLGTVCGHDGGPWVRVQER